MGFKTGKPYPRVSRPALPCPTQSLCPIRGEAGNCVLLAINENIEKEINTCQSSREAVNIVSTSHRWNLVSYFSKINTNLLSLDISPIAYFHSFTCQSAWRPCENLTPNSLVMWHMIDHVTWCLLSRMIARDHRKRRERGVGWCELKRGERDAWCETPRVPTATELINIQV